MDRIAEFTLNGKIFVYIDASNIKQNSGFIEIVSAVKPVIAKYTANSVYTITNIENIVFDTETKVIAGECLAYNKPYVKYGAIIGLDGIKKIMANAVFKFSGRKNMFFCFSKEQAIEWLLRQK